MFVVYPAHMFVLQPTFAADILQTYHGSDRALSLSCFFAVLPSISLQFLIDQLDASIVVIIHNAAVNRYGS